MKLSTFFILGSCFVMLSGCNNCAGPSNQPAETRINLLNDQANGTCPFPELIAEPRDFEVEVTTFEIDPQSTPANPILNPLATTFFTKGQWLNDPTVEVPEEGGYGIDVRLMFLECSLNDCGVPNCPASAVNGARSLYIGASISQTFVSVLDVRMTRTNQRCCD